MRKQPDNSSSAFDHRIIAGFLGSLAILFIASCKSGKPVTQTPITPPKETIPDLRSELAMTRVDLAKQAIERSAPEEALPLLVAALEVHPTCHEAINIAEQLLQSTHWFQPTTSINFHPCCVDHIELDSESTLWVALNLNDDFDLKSSVQTVIKWNLETMRIDHVLFPTRGNETSCMLFDPKHQYAVIKRSYVSSDDTVLLCDAQKLQPICNLGPLPNFLTPSAVIVFSADGLLLAHPTYASATDRSIIWHLRNTQTGEIIRTSTPTPPDKPAPIAAFLDSSRLRVMHADGVLSEMPTSLTDPEAKKPILEPVYLLQGQFETDGNSLTVLEQYRTNRQPSVITLLIDDRIQSPYSSPSEELERFPWSSNSHPNIWNGLFREQPFNAVKVDQTRVTFSGLKFPSYDIDSSITSVTLRGNRVAIGDINGGIHLFQTLPKPTGRKSANPFRSESLTKSEITSFANFSEALTGNRYDSTTRKLIKSDPTRRLRALNECDPEAIAPIFPNLDFKPIFASIRETQYRKATEESMIPLKEIYHNLSEKR